MAIATTNPVIGEILAALGLKNVTRLEMKMEIDRIVAVNVTYYPEVDGMKQLPAILAKYKLVPRGDRE